MATIQGTTGNDKVTVNSGDTYNALEGDDDITLMQWASTNPGKGNDTVRVIAGVVNEQATLQLWGAPGSIEVDLEAGYALDGHGTKHTMNDSDIIKHAKAKRIRQLAARRLHIVQDKTKTI